MIIKRETFAAEASIREWFSMPAGGVSPSSATVRLESNESNEDLPASVSFDDVPPGLRNSSNFFIAPALLAKSLAWRTCVVECQEGPNICLAINLQAAVLPTPVGPARIR